MADMAAFFKPVLEMFSFFFRFIYIFASKSSSPFFKNTSF